ncbi:HU family DNA-binding protein [Gammaproteobacteria bacterium]|nr:HU family DNA-binding protein [Gammaproteobacteria bacterium]
MNHRKKDIIKNIVSETDISYSEAANIMESFLFLIKSKSKSKAVKISNFGSFSIKKTPERVGRNPKTMVSYIISELSKLNFKPSNKLKEKIN